LKFKLHLLIIFQSTELDSTLEQSDCKCLSPCLVFFF